MSLTSALPKPKNNNLQKSKWANISSDEEEEQEPRIVGKNQKKKQENALEGNHVFVAVPPYGARKDFIPLNQADFNGGGAYPEIHINQYPLGMGLKETMGGASAASTLALQTDGQSGKIKYDMVLHQGSSSMSKKIIHSTLNDMRQQDTIHDLGLKPSQDEIDAVTLKTKEALDAMVDKKVKANKPKSLTETSKGGPTYVKYVPSESHTTTTAVADSRIIRISEAPVDPFEPSRFKHRKVPRAAGSPPPPVLRSPPRKVSAEEQKNWVIPPCISNWKNAKGYTIPLDKRLANDGRGMQDVTINDNFSKLSEALFIADRHAREEVKLRSELSTKVLQKEKTDKEEKLRMLAQKAREERQSATTTSAAAPAAESSDEESESSDEEDDRNMTAEERRKLKERQQLRRERARQREKELRKASSKGGAATGSGDRDISEKIALGIAQPTLSKDAMYDQRLFNQTSGISSGYGGPSDAYSIYDKPLFNSVVSNIYKPTVGGASGDREGGVEGVDVNSFEGMVSTAKIHRGFSGTEGTDGKGSSGPVQFEKEKDVFGVDAFISAAKRGNQDGEEKGDAKKSRR